MCELREHAHCKSLMQVQVTNVAAAGCRVRKPDLRIEIRTWSNVLLLESATTESIRRQTIEVHLATVIMDNLASLNPE
jgi:hypothetical protein